ncbi:MAG: tRNA 4-thiouridine(8) synthase ThiI [Candidatus Gracilibacteria bacterium]|nr:tRNA 4-thiouridine(8) synthase ThiI [Candidatus Gracilibacteria bacterium]
MKFLIKPFAEIMIKSKPVRKRYLRILQTNIKLGLKDIEPEIKVHLFWDKLEVNYIGELAENKIIQVRKILSRTPGVESFLEVQAFVLPTSPQPSPLKERGQEQNQINKIIFDFVFEKARDFYADKIEGKSFVCRVKRSGNHDFRSIDLERYVGGGLLQNAQKSRVDVKTPDITVSIEVKDENLFIVKDIFSGIGGYPIGTQDKVLSLISGGFDSGVSTFQMMKRGARVDFLFFNLGGSAHELGVKQVASYLSKNFSAGYSAQFVTIPFEDVVAELIKNINSKYRAIILKRLFLMVADRLASEYNYYALIKGDSLGQVSSQTLKNMFIIDKASSTLVLRPLIAYNKQEIIDITQKIGTYSFACNMPEYCGVVSDKPSTGAKLEKVLKEEEKFDFTLLEKAIENKKVERVRDMLKEYNSPHPNPLPEGEGIATNEIEICYVPGENEVIIDIREEEKINKSPLLVDGVEVLQIPFFDINHKFKDLDMSKIYLLYCDKGVISNLHAHYLKEKGFINVKVYRPLEKGCKIK